jgi:iron complex outermembrane receptor protein
MKKLTLFTLLALATKLCFSQITLSGQLKNTDNSVPIDAAFIRLSNANHTYTTYSTPNGSFQFDKLTAGTYTISVSHIGYRILVEKLELTASGYELFFMQPDMAFLDAAVISTVRARTSSPTTFSNLDKKEIVAMDQSKDFPFLLNMTPSTVISSDAGNGVGYTGIRVRGIDPTRVNITVNGIPINDGESQGMYWVNMPDLASSAQSVQIQRGVGTSTNGAASFGASVNIRTNDMAEESFTSASIGLGSFNTFRSTLAYGTGRLKNNWNFQLRGSLIQSDGFIDRASSDLKSLNFSAAKYWEKSVFKTNILLGTERTYQAWWGIPQPKLNGDMGELNRYINQLHIAGNELENLQKANSKTYNYYTYENEVDNYTQNHYQFFYDYNFMPNLKFNSAIYATTGKGYFEQFRVKDNLADYGIEDQIDVTDTTTNADLIRRRWLDNTLLGAIASVSYQKSKWDINLGGGYSIYSGRHFGEAIATEFTNYEGINAIYYDNDATKTDGNIYLKTSYNYNNWIPYVDLQIRSINYQFEGLDNNLDFGNQETSYTFLNPKAGLSYVRNNQTFYGVFAIGNREPVRDDFRNNPPNNWPEAEHLKNIELGYRYAKDRTRLGINLYNMDYTNQLVLTGAVNDVGEAIRTNVNASFRQGVELDFQVPLTDKLQFGGNTTLSKNKIANFTETVFEWDGNYAEISTNYENTDIAFSPNIISAAMLSYKPSLNFTFGFAGKYVGTQYLDNTQSSDRKLDGFTNLDANISYTNRTITGIENFTMGLYLNNVLNQFYAPNGYTFSGYINNQRQDFNYLYPMAGFNWMIKLGILL